MKIIHIIPNLKKGGAERMAINICNVLQNNGHDVCLISFENSNDYQFLTAAINHKVIPSSVRFSIRGSNHYEIDELQRFVDDFNPDVIHTHLFYAEAVLTGLKNSSASYFMHMHDNMPQLSKLNLKNIFKKSHWTNLYERRLVLKCMLIRKTSVIAISQDTFDYSHKNLPKETNVIILNNAIDINRFQSTNNWDERSERIVMTGSLVEKKGQELAIRTLAELHKKGIGFHLDLLGDGDLKSTLISLTKELNLEEYVHFHGSVDHPENYLSNAKIYLHTAKYEPFGLVLLEAMASKTPVVSTDGIGNRDIIQNKINGLILFNREPEELAAMIELVITDQSLRSRLVDNASNFVSTYSIQKYAEKLLNVYQSN